MSNHSNILIKTNSLDLDSKDDEDEDEDENYTPKEINNNPIDLSI